MGQQTISGQFPTSQGPSSQLSQIQYDHVATNDAALSGTATYPWNTGNYPVTAGPVTANGIYTQGLIRNNFGFTIPAIATIVGIQASVTRSYTGAANSFATYYAALTGLTAVQSKAYGSIIWSTIPTAEIYGGPLDMWGNTTITPAQVNSPTFGVEIGAFRINAPSNSTMQVWTSTCQVFYTLPGVNGIIIADASPDNFQTSQWTEGGALFYAVPAQPTLGGPWNIISYGIAFQGLTYQPNTGLASYGVLGSLWAGLLFNQITPPNIGASSWVNPMPQFPAGSALVSELWDGDTDTPFPFVNSAVVQQTARYLSYPVQLPVPVTMQPGENLSLALWLTPGLVQNAQLMIANATYEIVYDDSPQNT
jgi:hypothetical protein